MLGPSYSIPTPSLHLSELQNPWTAALPQPSSFSMLMKASSLWQGRNTSKWTVAGPKKDHWGRRERDKSPMLKPVHFYLPSNFTDFRMLKAIWVLWYRADKPLNHKFSKYNFYHKLVSLLGHHRKVWTRTVCMFKLYLPHVEDCKCTIKDHLQTKAIGTANMQTICIVITQVWAFSLIQLQAASKECKKKKKKNRSERHGSLRNNFK